jgi:DNA processing protein
MHATPIERTPDELLGPLNSVERKFAPPRFFLRGHTSVLESGPRVSVVGSRNASEEAQGRARALTTALVKHGVVVVSGLADGIDTVAHTTAIELGGRTIGVLGTSLEDAYPQTNQALQERIGREHLLVSQFEPGKPVHPSNFPIRNRTMALLSDATVIVEAGQRSGTEHQGWEALRLGRLLLIAETLAQRTDLAWVQKMRQYGAQVLSRSNFEEFIASLPERDRSGAVAL